MEGTNIQIGGGRKLVLGFDAGCMTCSELAKKIEEAVGTGLEVRSLHDPQVEHWRKQSLGENPSWTPTLIEVKPSSVKAWTGVRMGAALSLRVGPAATWRVMQALGDVRDTSQSVKNSPAAATTGISRGRFLKGLGGTAVALGVLTGTGNFASAASAREASQDSASEALKSIKKVDLTGEELVDAARRVAQRRDIMNLMGRTWSAKVRDGRLTASDDGENAVQLLDGSPAQTAGLEIPEASRISMKAARHQLRNGVTMLAVGYKLPQARQVLLYYEFSRPVPDGVGDEYKSRATLYRAEGDEAILERLSIDGKREVSQEISARSSCGTCGPGDCLRTVRVCTSIKWGCLAVACASCIPSCSSILGCLYCAGVQCPYAYNYGCCRRRGTRCAGCNYC